MRELRLQRPRRARRITLVALVDLVIILLIFFMLRTNFLQPRALGVGTSTQSQSDQPPPVPPMQVELHRDGELVDRHDEVYFDMLGEVLERLVDDGRWRLIDVSVIDVSVIDAKATRQRQAVPA